MKKKIKVIDFTGKSIEKEFNIPNKGLLDARLTHRPCIFKPKKGKGSFNRQQLKINNKELY